MKPFAESSEQNKFPILDVLQRWFSTTGRVLEIGSGTGQHAVFFSQSLPYLLWQASDRQENISGITQWVLEAGLPNLAMPLVLDVDAGNWPLEKFDYVFTANTAHIMSWRQVTAMFEGVGRTLRSAGVFCLYGPFNYAGAYTSESNCRFDAWLKQRDPMSGIRDFEALDQLAREQGLALLADQEMPMNNRTLVWRRD